MSLPLWSLCSANFPPRNLAMERSSGGLSLSPTSCSSSIVCTCNITNDPGPFQTTRGACSGRNFTHRATRVIGRESKTPFLYRHYFRDRNNNFGRRQVLANASRPKLATTPQPSTASIAMCACSPLPSYPVIAVAEAGGLLVRVVD